MAERDQCHCNTIACSREERTSVCGESNHGSFRRGEERTIGKTGVLQYDLCFEEKTGDIIFIEKYESKAVLDAHMWKESGSRRVAWQAGRAEVLGVVTGLA
ncbi:hypothetical protein V2W45_1345201 [Cenococcum geophilum]